MSKSIEWLLERLGQFGTRPFMMADETAYSYAWLLEQVARWEARLDEAGCTPGTVAALRGDYTPQVIATLLALIRNGAIIVPISPSAETQAREFMNIAEVQIAVTPDASPWSVRNRTDQRPSHEMLQRLTRRGHPGLVLFSSGSTGKSKAALHDFLLLLEKFRSPRVAMTTLAFLMIDHIGGVNTLFSVLSSGGTVVATTERRPDRVCELIEKCRVELLPTSPTFLKLMLLSEAYLRRDLSSLKLVTYGTESMPQSTLDSLRRVLPWARIQQTYGLSELGILRSKSEDSDSLWVRIGGEGYETKVEDGTLRIRAKAAMLGYLNAPSPFDSDGWFDTQDVVETKGEFVHFLGRRSEIVNVGGNKVYPAEVEDVLLQLENVKDASVIGQAQPITGEMVLARINLCRPEDPTVFRRRLRNFCRDRLEPFKIPSRILIVDQDQFSNRYKKMRQPTLSSGPSGW